MNHSFVVKKLNGDGLIKINSNSLDLGFGKGSDVLSMAELGFEVDAVNNNAIEIENFKSELNIPINLNYKINIIDNNIENFVIEKNKYNCIIASNSLPFIASKDKVLEIIKNIAEGLTEQGCFYITIFGEKDEWRENKNMSFFTFDEIKSFLDSLNLNFYHNTIEEGYAQTMKGDIKYWNIFKFIYIKK